MHYIFNHTHKVIFEMLFACDMVGYLLCCQSLVCVLFLLYCWACLELSSGRIFQSLTGESLHYRSAIKDDLDIASCGFWEISHQHAYFDVRVFNPYAPSYRSATLSSCFHHNELQKKRANEQRVCDVEMGCFWPLVFLAAGGCGPTADVVLKRLASCMATRQGKSHSLLASLPYRFLSNVFSYFVLVWLPLLLWTLTWPLYDWPCGTWRAPQW